MVDFAKLKQNKKQTNIKGDNTMTNEIAATNQVSELLIEETPKYSIYKLPDGKFEKRMKYEKFWTNIPESNEELIELYQVMNEQDSELVTPLKEAVGELLDIKHVYFNPYSSFDDETGTSQSGVTTTIQTQDGKYYATSSKSVYYNLQNMFEVFGTPGTEQYLGVRMAVTSTKAARGNQISLKLLGLSPKK